MCFFAAIEFSFSKTMKPLLIIINMKANKETITNRFLLRKLKKEDVEPMFRNWDNDPEVAKYTFWVAHESVN